MADQREVEQQYVSEHVDDIDVEIIDLDDTDAAAKGQQQIAQIKQAIVTWQHALTKKRVRGTSAFLFSLLVLLVLFLNFRISFVARLLPAVPGIGERLSTPVKVLPSLLIAQQGDGFVCTDGGAWSPDSRYVAIMGYTQCSNADIQFFTGTLIRVYDAVSGKSVAILQPDQELLPALQVAFPQQHETPSIFHRGLLWSPDGTHIALTLGITYKNGSIYTYTTALWLSDLSGKDAHVLVNKNARSSVNYLLLYTEWNVRHSQVMDSHVVSGSPYTDSASVPAAATYQWGTHGDLQPQGRYTVANPPQQEKLEAIGNPVGGQSFTLWQTASVELTKQGPTTDSTIFGPGVYLWYSNFFAWSPDGQYIIDAVSITARMEPIGIPKPTKRDIATLQMSGIPLIPIRDAALQAILRSFASKNDSRQDYAFVSWSPSGQTLAVQQSAWPRLKQSVDVYQSSTGYRRAVLIFPFLPVPVTGQNDFFGVGFSWSPDGSMILAQDSTTGVWAVWHVPALLQ